VIARTSHVAHGEVHSQVGRNPIPGLQRSYTLARAGAAFSLRFPVEPAWNNLCKHGAVASISRWISWLDIGSTAAVRIASASATGFAAALASLTRRIPPPVHVLPGPEPASHLSDTAQVEAAAAGPWSATRLRETLRTHLKGDRVIVLANREPCIHERTSSGEIAILHPASGLVTALEPVMRACSGVWVAHGSGSADRESSDSKGRLEVSTGDASYLLRRVWLSEEEEAGYYYGFANEALWPLCHLAHAHPVFRRSDWLQYQRVNQRFADAVAAEAGCDDPIVLVQDYHFALVPRMLRRRFPRATILTFWHIPWPDAERFSICPYQREILDGLLGSSIIGMQTPHYCHNFTESVDRTLEVRVARPDFDIVSQQRTTMVRAYPISIEWPPRCASVPDVAISRAEVRQALGLSPDTKIVVSVDRLDYTKGIEERLLTIERTLERWQNSGPLAFVQVGAPSRIRIGRYRELGDKVRSEVSRLNAKFSRGGQPTVILLDRHCEAPEIFRLYRAADACYVSSLHDGMNLVAKEFISARDDEGGVLLLSRFAGAARELTEALIVNPYDLEGVADTLRAALMMSQTEQRERMRALRSHVAEYNVYRWAGRMLLDATRLRQRERLHVRLAGRTGRRLVRTSLAR
jgi:trehalose 6-phosphate synthase